MPQRKHSFVQRCRAQNGLRTALRDHILEPRRYQTDFKYRRPSLEPGMATVLATCRSHYFGSMLKRKTDLFEVRLGVLGGRFATRTQHSDKALRNKCTDGIR